MGLAPKRQSKLQNASDSKLIVPASASSAADRAPRSRYLRAGTAFFGPQFFNTILRTNPRSLNQFPAFTLRIGEHLTFIERQQLPITHQHESINQDSPDISRFSGIDQG